MGNIMINSVKPITEYVQMCRSLGGIFSKSIPKRPVVRAKTYKFKKTVIILKNMHFRNHLNSDSLNSSRYFKFLQHKFKLFNFYLDKLT